MIKSDGRLRKCGRPRCLNTVMTFYECPVGECAREYVRCEIHGGLPAARRSLTSHKGLAHYDEAKRRAEEAWGRRRRS